MNTAIMGLFLVLLNLTTLHAPAALLGQQIEACYAAVEGLLSDRLANPKFAWPADARTGIAHRWHPLAAASPSW